MKVEIKVPAMGESIAEAIIGQIFKPTGSYVQEDDEILELETDKVNQVLYAPKAGMIQLTVKTDDTVTIGQIIGSIDTSADVQPEKKQEKAPAAPIPTPPIVQAPPKKEPAAAPTTGEARISKDSFVKSLSEAPAPAAAPAPKPVQPKPAASQPAVSGERETRKRMSRIRQVIAERLVEVKQTTAMLTTFNEVDLSDVINIRSKNQEDFQKAHGIKLGFMSFFIKATVEALKKYPEINAYIDGNEIVYRNYYDISIAIGTDKGLVVPVVRNCDQLSFPEIEQEILNYAKRAREGTLTVEDLQGGGFTITNGGTYGSLLSTPILNPPQSGILGMHSIQKRAVVVDDQIVIRPMMYLALSYDHRIIDGKEAVSFLVHIKNLLENPARLFMGF